MSYNTSGNFQELVGKRLFGFMPITRESKAIDIYGQKYEPAKQIAGKWDNALIFYLGDKNNPETYVLRTENQDYSCYDHWVIGKINPPQRDDKYKAIGEKILSVTDISEKPEIRDRWSKEENLYWLEVKTKTKVIRLGHHWNDCHYPNGIWDVT